MADRAREAASAVHARRGLGSAAALGHGHRQPGPDRRRLPRGVPDQPGRQQAPDPGRWIGRAAIRGHRAPAGRDRPQAVPGRRAAGLDGLASRVRGRQQRRPDRPVRQQGQRRVRSSTTPPTTRATCSSARRTARSPRALRRRASSASSGPVGRRSSTSISTGCWTSSRSSDARTSGCGATSGRATATSLGRWAAGSRSTWSRTRRTTTRSGRGSRSEGRRCRDASAS